MKQSKLLFLILLFFQLSFAQNFELALIPKPQSVKLKNGFFTLDSNSIIIPLSPELNFLSIGLERTPTLSQKKLLYQIAILGKSKKLRKSKNSIFLKTDSTLQHKDEYVLEITKKHILIRGRESGVYYGLVSLMQLIEMHSGAETNVNIPCCKIQDYPSFEWRGMHLDCSRHFFPIDFIKKYIDLLALYKMNVFHWHLTDDQGWRIEIKKYPKLTEIGAWRNGSQQGKYNEQKFDTLSYGGFYTQDEIKQIVNYANNRHITIVPEIEMPGHSLAALASYSNLGCKDTLVQVAKGWGVFDDVYCPTDATFDFLENILSEVMNLFPSKYIHIGGDECPKLRWKKSEFCQQLMKTEGLKDEHELQSYFIRRIEKFVNSKGRQIIGWDEILEGGLAPNAAVMSWRGESGGIEAAKQKHKVVMTPGSHCYFDHYQFKPDSLEPIAIGGFTSVEKVYSYNPIPDTLTENEKKYILGAQGNVWTEYILTPAQVEYMALPRMSALAEVLWLGEKKGIFQDFRLRLIQHFKLLDKLKVNYAKHILN